MARPPQEPSSTGSSAFVFKVTLARNAKAEAIYFPTIYVIPPSAKAFGPMDIQLADHAAALCMEAIRKIDPEIGEMTATLVSGPAFSAYHEPASAEPALRKNGWKIHIEWDP